MKLALDARRPVFFHGLLFVRLIGFCGLCELFSAVATASTLLSTLPVPCSPSLGTLQASAVESTAMLTAIQNCLPPFGSCIGNCGHTPCSGQMTDDPGVISTIEDTLIRNVVGIRIQNLYHGYNGLYPPHVTDASGQIPYPTGSQLWNPSARSEGPCYLTGACNLFCGEVTVPLPQFQIPSAVNLGSQGFLEESGPLFMDGTGGQTALVGTGGRYDPPNVVDRNPQLSDFRAIGAISPLSPTYVGPTPLSSSAPSSGPTPPGWPKHAFTGILDSALNACSSGVNGQRNINDIDPADHGGLQNHGKYEYKVKTLAWDDSSFAAGNGEQDSCDLFYVPDFAGAQAMTSLHTGALVQANWMALQEVIQELNTGSLKIYHAPCQTLAQNTISQVTSIVTTLSSITGACQMTLLQASNDCLANPLSTGAGNSTQLPLQSKCYISAIMQTLANVSFGKVAECEVYSRANDWITDLFLTSNSLSSGLSYGAQWMLQLKNWAVTGCLIANFHNVSNGGGDVDSAGRTQEHSDTNDEVNFLAASYQDALHRCFPYTYTAAFKAYLSRNNNGHALSTVPIQGYTAGTTNPAGTGYQSKTMVRNQQGALVPTVQLQNCQLIDTPAPRSSSQQSSNHWMNLQNEKSANLLPFSSLLDFTGSTHSKLCLLALQLRRSTRGFKRGLFPKKLRHIRTLVFRLFALLSLLGLLIPLFLAFGLGCADSSPTDIYMFAFVNTYCVGQNGILLSANTQAQNCCTYTRQSGWSGSGSQNDLSTSQLYNQLTRLHGSSLTGAAANSARVQCPGGLAEVLLDVTRDYTQAHMQLVGSSSLLNALSALAANQGGITASSTQAAATNDATTSDSGSESFAANAASEGSTHSSSSSEASRLASTGNTSSALNSLFESTLGKSSGKSSGNTNLFVGNGNNSTEHLGTLTASTNPATPTPPLFTSNMASTESVMSGKASFRNAKGGSSLIENRDLSDTAETTTKEWNASAFKTQNPTAETSTPLDPADYFTRIDLSETLFKVIEKKYREKAQGFVSSELVKTQKNATANEDQNINKIR